MMPQVLLPPPSIPMESHIDVPLLPSSGANTAAPLLSLPEISLEPVQMPTTPVTQSVPPVSKSPIAPFNNLLRPVTAVSAPESTSHAPIAAGATSLLAQALAKNVPRRPRGEKKPIPDNQKDNRYFERRRRNNLAAKKSRDQRKQREESVALRAGFLEKENAVLRAQLSNLKEEKNSLQALQLKRSQMRVLRAAAEAAASATTPTPSSPPAPTPALLSPAAADQLAKPHTLQQQLSRASSSNMDNSEGIMDLSKKDTQTERSIHQNYTKSIDVNRNDISSNNKNEVD